MKRSLFVLPVTLFLCGLTVGGSSQLPQGHSTISSDLAVHPAGAHLHRVIVQAGSSALSVLHGGGFGHLRRDLQGAVALEVTDAQLDAMQRNPAFAHISGDLPVVPHMTTTTTDAITNKVTLASTVWQGTPGLLGLLGGTPGYTGTGVTVAILDSGINTHAAINGRVLAHVNMVTDEPGVTGDSFGHGTHIAGIVGGNTTAALRVTPSYAGGSAPNVWLVDVRVLGALGSGRTSDVIAGIDWVIANRQTYHIRIINLSLGHAVTEPSATDPLCQAVSRAVAAGITVSVSAGNYGLTSTGAPVLGGITSPGDSPDALTVGATDTNGTLATSDDVVAPYSSKGPTAFDFIVKPDVVAPGTRITSLESPGSFLSTTYPQWHMAGTGTNAYMRLSGTSMATAVVSGGAALLLNAQPSLNPAQLKMAIQMGARFMPKEGLISAGAGAVNFQQSLKMAQSGLLNSLLGTVSALLGGSSGAAYRDEGTLIDRVYDRSGIRLLGLLDFLPLFKNAGGAEPGVLNLLGTNNSLGATGANYLVWGNVANWSGSYYLVWGNSVQDPSGEYLVWGNNESTDSTYLVWGNSVVGGH